MLININKQIASLVLITVFCFNACSQDKNTLYDKSVKVSDGCEGCEGVYESQTRFENLSSTDTLPDFFEQGQKLEISGTVFFNDGKTPAAGIVIYLYHTDQNGYYSNKYNDTGWAARHGYIRGWLKTGSRGEYKFYTLRPASYPNSTIPAHIHPTIKEPGKLEYWIDDFVFDDDKFVDEKYRSSMQNRGGSGIVKLTETVNGLFKAERDIVLGLNIPAYK